MFYPVRTVERASELQIFAIRLIPDLHDDTGLLLLLVWESAQIKGKFHRTELSDKIKGARLWIIIRRYAKQ